MSLPHSVAYENDRVLKDGPGRLKWLVGYNSLNTAQFIQLHDAAEAPTDTAVPILVITAPAAGNFSVPLPADGIQFAEGVYVCNSTTGPTKTLGADNCYFTGFVI